MEITESKREEIRNRIKGYFNKESKDPSEQYLKTMLKETRDLCFYYERELMKRGVEVKPVKRSLGFYNKIHK
jgi:ribosomal protein S4